MMTKEIGQQGIDLLIKMYDENKEDALINHHTKGLIIEFIGGEPFMNIEVIEYLTQQFLDQCIKKQHIWLTNTRFSIASNGMLYFTEPVQKYLNKYGNFISLGITIDGPKELHDACRKDHFNNGSFDTAFSAWLDWKTKARITHTKITIAPENLQYIDEIFSFFITNDCDEIYANPIFEHKWTIEEARIYYRKLILLSKYLLNHNTYNNIFEERMGRPMLSSEDSNWCGGTGAMLAFDPDGLAYPCIRYMPSSLGTSQKPLIIGNVDGIYNTLQAIELKHQLDTITRHSQSTIECINCNIAEGCAWCSGWNYQENGTCNKRSTNICWMHRARTLANVYYWNNYYKKNQIDKKFILYLDRNIATNIISNEEYDNLLSLSIRR